MSFAGIPTNLEIRERQPATFNPADAALARLAAHFRGETSAARSARGGRYAATCSCGVEILIGSKQRGVGLPSLVVHPCSRGQCERVYASVSRRSRVRQN